MKRKVLILSIFLFFILCKFNLHNIKAETVKKDLKELYNYSTFIENDYAQYAEKTHYGKYYKVGIMGHRQVVELGEIKLVAKPFEQISSNQDVNAVSSITVTESTTYRIENKITATANYTVGQEEMIKAMLELNDIASVGGTGTLTTEYKFALEKTFAEELQKNYEIQTKYDVSNIPSDKESFSISRISIYLEVNIIKSYTEESRWFGGWGKVGGTTKENYKASCHLYDIVTFLYNDGTFGTVDGLYSLTEDPIYEFIAE